MGRIETMLEQMMKKITDSDAQLASHNTSIRNLEVQLGQISQALNTRPKGHYLVTRKRDVVRDEPERPAKKPHIQEFVEASQEPWDWVQVAADEGEKNKLAQENKALKAQIRQMRIDADNQQRSRSDERLINRLKKEIIEHRDDLKKSEGAIAQLRAQWAKVTKERTQYLQQVKKEYEKTIAKLKGKMTTLKDKAAK
ncbi:uncharacterized protein [Nicotiana sylvestris]|uniref:uncharacterized protein n=1 Tax=Nicotiana sylvestris TaxID=4096 RepID=UPI00388CADB5